MAYFAGDGFDPCSQEQFLAHLQAVHEQAKITPVEPQLAPISGFVYVTLFTIHSLFKDEKTCNGDLGASCSDAIKEYASRQFPYYYGKPYFISEISRDKKIDLLNVICQGRGLVAEITDSNLKKWAHVLRDPLAEHFHLTIAPSHPTSMSLGPTSNDQHVHLMLISWSDNFHKMAECAINKKLTPFVAENPEYTFFCTFPGCDEMNLLV